MFYNKSSQSLFCMQFTINYIIFKISFSTIKKAPETDAFSHSQYVNVIVTKEYPSFALYGSAL